MSRIKEDIPYAPPITINLDVARSVERFPVWGDRITVENITGTCKIRIGRPEAGEINLERYTEIRISKFDVIYVTNDAQPGKSVTLMVGGDASFSVTPYPMTKGRYISDEPSDLSDQNLEIMRIDAKRRLLINLGNKSGWDWEPEITPVILPSGSWTSDGVHVAGFSMISVKIDANTSCTISAQFSHDNINWFDAKNTSR